MSRRLRILLALLLALLLVVGGGAGALGWMIFHPSYDGPPLPESAVPFHTPASSALLQQAGSVDVDPLVRSWQRQETGSWCGVASSVTVLNARGASLTQSGFFTPEATAVRSWLATVTGGMPLRDLEGMVEAHGAEAEVTHASEASLEAFRAELQRNTHTAGDYLIVNYDRKVLGQSGGGHISPVGAVSADGSQVLILDTASYKYPFHWVATEALFDAMNTPDSETAQSRGWVVVR